MMIHGMNDFFATAKVKEQIRNALHYFSNPEFYSDNGVTPPRGIIISGDEGCGKTMLMKCIAKEIGADIEDWDDDTLMAISGIQESFPNPEFSHLIMLDDVSLEKEDLLKMEMAQSEETDNWKYQNCFSIITAKSRQDIPEFLLLSNEIYPEIHLQIPETLEELQYYPAIMLREKICCEIPSETLIKLCYGLSQKEFQKVLKTARFYAACKGETMIREETMIKAILKVHASPSGPLDSEMITCHEVGHAVISEALMDGSVGLISAMEVEGENYGITKLCLQPEKTWDRMNYHLHVLLGGYAAKDCIPKRGYDLGCSSDLDKAFLLAREMITNDCIWGAKWHSMGELDSEALKAQQDEMIATLVTNTIKENTKILNNNLSLLWEIDRALREKCYLTHEDIAAIKEKYPIK